MASRKDTSCFALLLIISSEQISKPNSRAGHNFLKVRNIWIIFGRGIDKEL